MEDPKTRRESKKTAKEKRASVYSAKHTRLSQQAAMRHAVRGPAVAVLRPTSTR